MISACTFDQYFLIYSTYQNFATIFYFLFLSLLSLDSAYSNPIQSLCFLIWLISLSIALSKPLQVVTNGKIPSFLWLNNIPLLCGCKFSWGLQWHLYGQGTWDPGQVVVVAGTNDVHIFSCMGPASGACVVSGTNCRHTCSGEEKV